MRFVKVKYSKGNLGRNIGCEKTPDFLLNNERNLKIADVDQGNVDETMIRISEIEGDFFVGGDHSITYGSFKGFYKIFKNSGIIIFDAHPDLEINSGSVTHEDYLRKLIEEKVLKKQDVILVGIRKVSKNERKFIKGVKVYYMKDIVDNEDKVCDEITNLTKRFDGLYLSVDIDVLDPKFAPGTGYFEKNGMSLKQLIYFLKKIKKLRNLRRIDLVEINPDKDVNRRTIKAGKKIVEVFR